MAHDSAKKRQVIADANRLGTVEAATNWGIPVRTVQTWVKNQGQDQPQTPEALLSTDDLFSHRMHSHPEFVDKKMSELDVEQLFDAIELMQGVVSSAGLGQHEARVKIATTEPVVLLPTADWHLGSYATDHRAFREFIQFILATPHVYVLDVGDEIDNFTQFKSVGAVLGQVVPPKIQKRALAILLKTLVEQGKLVARCWGNHLEDFDDRVFGGALDDFNALCPYLKDDGRLFLEVGGIEYRVLAKHITRGSSIHNVNQGNMRAIRFGEWPQADMVISGHTHNGPEHVEWLHGDDPKLAVKVGTFKTDDTHSRRYYQRSHVSYQGIVLFPDRKKMVPFRQVEDAIAYRDAVARTSAQTVLAAETHQRHR